MRKTFLIIVHYGKLNDTYDCLKSIYSGNYAPPIILINNSIDPKLKDKVRQFKKIDLIIPNRNLGFAGANNFAIKKALSGGAENIILLNNDTLVPIDFCKNLIDYASISDKGLISPKIYFAKGFEYHKDKYQNKDLGHILWYAGGSIDWNNIYASHRGVDEVDKGQYDRIENTDFATGCAVLIKKEVIEKTGLIDENYFLYYEDVDYSLSARQKGFLTQYYPYAFVWHKNAGSSQGPGSPLHQYYQTRNRLYFGFKFARLRTKLALIKESIAQIAKGQIIRRAVFDFYFKRMGKSDIWG